MQPYEPWVVQSWRDYLKVTGLDKVAARFRKRLLRAIERANKRRRKK